MTRAVVLALAFTACATTGGDVAKRSVDEADRARAAVAAFLAAVSAQDFDAALGCLGPPWTSRYTAPRLAQDFAAEPLARERIDRLARALPKLTVDGASARVPIDEAHAATLARIDGHWKLITLE